MGNPARIDYADDKLAGEIIVYDHRVTNEVDTAQRAEEIAKRLRKRAGPSVLAVVGDAHVDGLEEITRLRISTLVHKRRADGATGIGRNPAARSQSRKGLVQIRGQQGTGFQGFQVESTGRPAEGTSGPPYGRTTHGSLLRYASRTKWRICDAGGGKHRGKWAACGNDRKVFILLLGGSGFIGRRAIHAESRFGLAVSAFRQSVPQHFSAAILPWPDSFECELQLPGAR